MTDPTNADRAARIDDLILRYAQLLTDGPVDLMDECNPQDLLTDLLHWLKREGMDWMQILRMAECNFRTEVEEENAKAIPG
jgi:hypothetical protein